MATKSSKLITSCLTAVKKLIKYYETTNELEGKKSFFVNETV